MPHLDIFHHQEKENVFCLVDHQLHENPPDYQAIANALSSYP